MKYFMFLKWDLYANIKRRIINTKIFKGINRKFVICIWILLSILKIVGVMCSYNYIVYINEKNINNIVILDIIIKCIMDNSYILNLFILFYVIVDIIITSNKVARLVSSCQNIDWISVNMNLRKSKILMCLYCNYTIIESGELFTLIIPIVFCFYFNRYNALIGAIGKSLVFLFFLVIIKILIAMLIYYKLEVKKIINEKTILLKNIIRIVMLLAIFRSMGSSFSEWMNKFPLVKKNIEGRLFQQWIDEFVKKIEYILIKISTMSQIIINLDGIILLLISLNFLIIIFVIVKKGLSEKKHCSDNVKKTNLNHNIYLTSIIRSRYLINNINYVMGASIFWGVIGFYGGLMTKVLNNKIILFLSMTCVFYFSLFLAQSLIGRLNVIYSIDGEGKKVYIWISNVYKLYCIKRKIWIMNITIISLIEYLYFSLCIWNIHILISGLLQILYLSVLFSIYNIPGILFPYFDYKNPEELSAYIDRKNIYDYINAVTILVINTICVLPTALYMADDMNVKNYYITQFILTPIIIIIIGIIVNYYIKNTVTKLSYINKIYVK